MFKSATIFKITLPQPMLVATLDEALQAHVFEPVGSTQQLSVGWVPPRGEAHGLLVESIAGQLIMRLMIETRAVPGQALRDGIDAACKIVEQQTGRKPGKKERSEIADEVKQVMLPKAFPKRSGVLVWIDSSKGLLVIDSASSGVSDHVISMLVRCVEGVVMEHHQFGVSPSTLMTSWLHDRTNLSTHDRFGFDIARSCQLKAADETKAVVTYKKHSLDTDEVKQHILHGKRATRLDLVYADRVGFTLTEAGVLAGITFLDVVFEAQAKKDAADRFDADVAIMAGELDPLIESMHQALDAKKVEGGAE